MRIACLGAGSDVAQALRLQGGLLAAVHACDFGTGYRMFMQLSLPMSYSDTDVCIDHWLVAVFPGICAPFKQSNLYSIRLFNIAPHPM